MHPIYPFLKKYGEGGRKGDFSPPNSYAPFAIDGSHAVNGNNYIDTVDNYVIDFPYLPFLKKYGEGGRKGDFSPPNSYAPFAIDGSHAVNGNNYIDTVDNYVIDFPYLPQKNHAVYCDIIQRDFRVPKSAR